MIRAALEMHRLLAQYPAAAVRRVESFDEGHVDVAFEFAGMLYILCAETSDDASLTRHHSNGAHQTICGTAQEVLTRLIVKSTF